MSRDASPFAVAVQDHFAFLESAFGFDLADADHSAVRYERGDIVVGIFQERLSGELGVGIGRREQTAELERPYTLAEMVAITDLDAGRRYPYRAPTSASALHSSLAALAADLLQHGTPGLHGSEPFFTQLAAVRERLAADFDFDLRGRHLRSAAEAAWRTSDWPKVAALYAAIEDDLSPDETARLRDARQHPGQ